MDPALQKKLRLVDQNPILVIGAPDDMKLSFDDRTVDEHHTVHRKYPFILAFIHDLTEATHLAGNLVSAYPPEGCLWLAFPKGKSKKYHSDVSVDSLWGVLAPYDFEPVKEVSLNDDWNVIQFRHMDEIIKKDKKTLSPDKGRKGTGGGKKEDIESLISHGHVIP